MLSCVEICFGKSSHNSTRRNHLGYREDDFADILGRGMHRGFKLNKNSKSQPISATLLRGPVTFSDFH